MEYWYLWLLFLALCVLTGVVLKKASGAVGAHHAETQKIYAEIERLKTLKETYRNADDQLLADAPAEEALCGLQAVLQSRIERVADANACFCEWNAAKQAVYTLPLFLEDAEKSLSEFFKRNGEPLLSALQPALAAVGETAVLPTVSEMYSMYDENNETVSLDAGRVQSLDTDFRQAFDRDAFLERTKGYLREHRSEILE